MTKIVKQEGAKKAVQRKKLEMHFSQEYLILLVGSLERNDIRISQHGISIGAKQVYRYT